MDAVRVMNYWFALADVIRDEVDELFWRHGPHVSVDGFQWMMFR